MSERCFKNDIGFALLHCNLTIGSAFVQTLPAAEKWLEYSWCIAPTLELLLSASLAFQSLPFEHIDHRKCMLKEVAGIGVLLDLDHRI